MPRKARSAGETQTKGAKGKQAKAGDHGIHSAPGSARKSTGETEGQYSRDGRGRKGQFTGAGDSSMTKK